MPVASLPKLGAPPAPARLKKIALEEHFGHPSVFMRDSEGRYETHKMYSFLTFSKAIQALARC